MTQYNTPRTEEELKKAKQSVAPESDPSRATSASDIEKENNADVEIRRWKKSTNEEE
jgi:hypothetical protein